MGNGSGVSRGDRSRNARLERLRALVPVASAIVGIDLADAKQMVVVTDHDSKVLARRTFRCRAWDLGQALDWAAVQARAGGFAGVTVACEPAGHRWRVLGQLAGARGMPFVCVQPMLTSWARRSEDLTFDKTDEKDAVLIARLAAQLRCYVPEPVDEIWGRLRHPGARRAQLLAEAGSQVQQMRALLECAWPASLDTARQPFRWATWPAAMWVILDRDGGDLARTRRLGLARFEAAVRREVIRRGRQKPCMRIVRQLFAALADPAGVIAHRPGALERVAFLMDDWRQAHHRLADTETRMTRIIDDLQLTDLVTSITGLSPAGAAAILAETGDLRRFATGRALARHAGLAPREKLSGTFTGRTKLTGQGRPGLRLAAWRAVWGAAREPGLRCPVHSPDQPRPEQAHRHPGPGRDRRGDLASAARRHHHRPALGPRHRHPRRHTLQGSAHRGLTPGGPRAGSGRAPRGMEEPRLPRRSSWAAPPVVPSTRLHAAGTNPITAMQGQTTDEAPTQRLDANRLTLMTGRSGGGRGSQGARQGQGWVSVAARTLRPWPISR